MAATASMRAMAISGFTGVDPSAGATAVETKVCVPFLPIINWYARFLNGPEVKPLTPNEKALLAGHNLLDPFNCSPSRLKPPSPSPSTPIPPTAPA